MLEGNYPQKNVKNGANGRKKAQTPANPDFSLFPEFQFLPYASRPSKCSKMCGNWSSIS